MQLNWENTSRTETKKGEKKKLITSAGYLEMLENQKAFTKEVVETNDELPNQEIP